MFKNVFVKTFCPSVCGGIASTPELGKPIYKKALEQHAAYIEELKKCGVEATALPEPAFLRTRMEESQGALFFHIY